MFHSIFWRHFDFWLLGAVIIALVFGVTMIRSAIAGNVTLAGLVPRQIIFGAVGFVVILLAAAIDYRFWSGANSSPPSPESVFTSRLARGRRTRTWIGRPGHWARAIQ